MSKDRIRKFKVPQDEGYTIIPNKLPKDKRVSVLARLLLVYLLSNSETWVVLTGVAADEIGVNEKTLTGAIRELYNVGYIRRDRVRNPKGHFSHWDYEVHYEPVFENEKWESPKKRIYKKPELLAKVDENPPKPDALPLQGLQPQAEKPPVVKPPVARARLPMPNPPMPNKPMAMEAMPSYKNRQKAMEASPGKKDPSVRGRNFKRPEEQEMRFQWLLGLELTDDKGQVNEEALSYLAHTYTQEKLERTYFHLVYKMDKKGVKPKSAIALYRHLLANEHNCRASHAELNEAMARKFASELGWGTLEFKEKYVIDRNNPSKDIDFNLDPATFKDLLSGLYMSLNSNYGT